MSRTEAWLALQALVSALPPGTVEEQTAKAAERLAAHESADALSGFLVEFGLRQMVKGTVWTR